MVPGAKHARKSESSGTNPLYWFAVYAMRDAFLPSTPTMSSSANTQNNLGDPRFQISWENLSRLQMMLDETFRYGRKVRFSLRLLAFALQLPRCRTWDKSL